MPSFQEMFPSRFVNSAMLESGPLHLTINDVTQETVNNDGEQRWALNFAEIGQLLSLNKTNASTLAGLFGGDSDGWIGKRITLVRQEVEYKGARTWGVRISLEVPGPVPEVQAQAGPPDPVEPGNDSEIPF